MHSLVQRLFLVFIIESINTFCTFYIAFIITGFHRSTGLIVVWMLNAVTYSVGSNVALPGNKNRDCCSQGQVGNGKKPSIMSSAQLEGSHCPQSWFYWPWDLQQDFPLIRSSQEGSSHHNLYPACVQVWPSRHNQSLRQPLNEDTSASLSHGTLTKLSIVFVCCSPLTSSSPSNVSILPSSQNRLAQCQRVYTQNACGQFGRNLLSGTLERESCVLCSFKAPFINFAKKVDIICSVSPQSDPLFWITIARSDGIVHTYCAALH